MIGVLSRRSTRRLRSSAGTRFDGSQGVLGHRRVARRSCVAGLEDPSLRRYIRRVPPPPTRAGALALGHVPWCVPTVGRMWEGSSKGS
jgi:transposase InsO family protein